MDRTTWELELDISAPQIIFVEQFTNNNSAMAVLDFGRLQLSNRTELKNSKAEFSSKPSADDDETFLTPCSTPPASEASDSDENTTEFAPNFESKSSFNERSLHYRLYDRYSVELTDLQVLVGECMYYLTASFK